MKKFRGNGIPFPLNPDSCFSYLPASIASRTDLNSVPSFHSGHFEPTATR